jgi:hypothetical protein
MEVLMIFGSRAFTRGHKPFARSNRAVVVLGIVLFLFPGLAQAQAATATDTGACTQVAQAVFKSCGFGAQDDYWLAVARCDNKTRASARTACLEAAAAERTDATSLCAEQRDAREDVCDQLGQGPYSPAVNPAHFTTEVTNPYFPLKPGMKWVYEGQVADGFEHTEVVVTGDTREILGVTCLVVRDTTLLDGELSEDTLDFFAQDDADNVWYFGEESKSYEDGLLVDIEGSWLAGRDDAKPGIIMEAHPKVGDVYRQEYAIGVAEDLARVVAVDQQVSVPFGSFSHVLKTAEFTPIEPDALEQKFYAPGVGLVKTIDVDTEGGTELIAFETP